MSAPVSSIRNLGPAADISYGRAGINTARALRALGPDEAYLRMLLAGGRPHFIGYYAMVMGVQGRPWNDCQGAEKAALRQRFDALSARARAAPPQDVAIDVELRRIGVIVPPSKADHR